MACAKLAPLFEFGWAGLAGSLWLGVAWAHLTQNDPTVSNSILSLPESFHDFLFRRHPPASIPVFPATNFAG
jgi:hypothetical protein